VYAFLSIVGGGYVLFFTSIPFEIGYANFAPKGTQATGISGSLFKGITIEQLVWKAADGSFETEQHGLRFQYTNPIEVVTDRRLVLEHFTVDRVVTKIQSLAAVTGFATASPSAHPTLITPAATPIDDSPRGKALRALEMAFRKAFVGPDAFIHVLGIHELRISNYSVEYPKTDGSGTNSYEIKEFRIGDFLYEPNSKKLSLGEIYFSDEKQEFGLKGLSIYDTGARIASIDGKMKVAFDPDRIRQDIDYHLKFEGSLKDYQNLKVSLNAIGGKVRVTVGPQMALQIFFAGVTVREIYNLALPITNLNLELSSPNFMGALSGVVTAKGDFKIGETPFQFTGVGLNANATVGRHTFTLAADPSRFAREVAPGEKRPFFLHSTYSKSAQENLSQLYFQSRYAQLDDVRRMQIDTDLTYFDRSVPASTGVAVKGVQNVRTTPAPRVERYPANEKSNRRATSRKDVRVHRMRRR
jgi:hypothetical protein